MKQTKKFITAANAKLRDFLASLCFSGPSFLGMLIFFVAPFCVVIYYSFIADRAVLSRQHHSGI